MRRRRRAWAISRRSAGVVKFPVRIKCATLSWNTLAQGIEEARG